MSSTPCSQLEIVAPSSLVSRLNFNTFNYRVNNFVKWACGINNHPLRYIFGGMKSKDQFFFLFIPTPIINSTTIQSFVECFGIHVQYGYFVE
jgi:hypothetical protein